MALALHQSGILCLHGSAVTIGGRAVAFLGPKNYGKSTLASVLTATGARLLTDDLVAIDPSSSPVALPGVHSIRLLADVAEQVREKLQATARTGYKQTLTNLREESLVWTPAPLDAVYLVRPVKGIDGSRAVSRELVPPLYAAASLAQNKKLTDDLVGLEVAGIMMRSIARVIASVPVYELRVIRDLERLAEAAATMMEWHRTAAGASAP
jgi:serine kinase of HPr protein (carbohydrate metabolism regulator)